MNEERIGAVLVVSAERLVGIFTERDVLKKLAGRFGDPSTPVRDLRTEDPTSLHRDDAIVFALKQMHEGGFRHVPLLDDDQSRWPWSRSKPWWSLWSSCSPPSWRRRLRIPPTCGRRAARERRQQRPRTRRRPPGLVDIPRRPQPGLPQ
jgi:CBS domain-containing protein